jgi:hypothetical protein
MNDSNSSLRTVWYTVIDHDPDYRFRAELKWSCDFETPWEISMAAEDCADDYHSRHDGWESSWPLVFALYREEDGPELARFDIDREAVPQFTAALVKEKT